MADLVAIIRPFGPAVIRPRPTMPSKAPTQPPDGPNLVTWGGSGNTIFQLRANLKATVPKPLYDEETRTFDKVRVKNPDDADQHVDVEYMTGYTGRNATDKSQIKLAFTPPVASPELEILARNQTRNTILP